MAFRVVRVVSGPDGLQRRLATVHVARGPPLADPLLDTQKGEKEAQERGTRGEGRHPKPPCGDDPIAEWSALSLARGSPRLRVFPAQNGRRFSDDATCRDSTLQDYCSNGRDCCDAIKKAKGPVGAPNKGAYGASVCAERESLVFCFCFSLSQQQAN